MCVFSLSLLSAIGVSGATISSVASLASSAGNSNQTIVMTPGVYQMDDYLTPTVIANTVADSRGYSAMINFSGSNNTFDFTGVTIEVDTDLLDDFGTKVMEFYVTGDNVHIKGLTVTDIGELSTFSGGQSFTVDGEDNTIEGVTLNVRGSSPYGYGDLLGKGNPNLVAMQKHSGMLIEGLNIDIIDCSIYSRSMGHLFFIQGGRNVLFQGCHAEAVTRATDDMLAETSGMAFDLGFEAVYRNYAGVKEITSGYTKSLSEVGYRSYGSGGINGNTTGAITLVNCSAKETRSGFAFVRYGGDVIMQNCEAIGCEAGYQVEEVTIENSRGDAVNGPLLYLNGGPSTVELTLIPNVATTTLHAIATIGGDDHTVTLNKMGDRPQTHSILVGTTRPAGANPFSPLGTTSTSNLDLTNNTGMPVVIGSTATSNTIVSNAAVTDNGSSNSVTIVSSDDNTPVSQDIGNVAATGNASEDGGTYTVESSGADIWNTADELRFVYETLRGDGEVVARVVSVENTNNWAKSGVMIRESLSADSKCAMVYQRPDKQVGFQVRAATGGSSARYGSLQGGTSAVKYVRVVRDGNNIRGYYSTSSASGPWTQIGTSQSVSMGMEVYVGLAATSHNDGTLCTSVFDNVAIGDASDPNIVGEWTFDDVSSIAVYDGGLYGNDATASGGTIVSGNTGNAMDFDGVDDSVSLPASAFSTIDDEVTISMWVYGDSSQARSDTAFAAVDASGNRVINIHLPWSNSRVYFDAGNSGTSSYDRIYQTASSSEFEGQWNHWAFVKNASTGEMKMYLNGALFKSGTGKTRTMSGVTTATLGSSISSLTYDGSIDEVILYDIALSAAEVSSLYNSY